MFNRLFIVFILGFSSGLPFALLSGTLQAWYAESGLSVLATGMLSLIGLPYTYRLLWAPYIDSLYLKSFGRRRSWILLTQGLILIGFNCIVWFSPTTHPGLIAVFALLLAFFSASQDMAIDAHRVEYLSVSEHGMGASMAMLGFRIALLVGGGGALVLAAHLGWIATYRIMGCLMAIGMLATWLSEEPVLAETEIHHGKQAFLVPLRDLFQKKQAILMMAFILIYKLGESFTATTSGVVMPFLIQGLGFSLETIGYVNQMLGIGTIITGGLFAGYILLHYSLRRALLVFGIIQALANALFILLAYQGQSLVLLVLAVGVDNLAVGMGSTALVVLLMRWVNPKFTATQFAFLVSLTTIPRLISGPIAGFLQGMIGWIGIYMVSFFLALSFLPLMKVLWKSFEAIDRTEPKLATKLNLELTPN